MANGCLVSVLAMELAVLVVVAMVGSVEAVESCVETFSLAGRKYKVQNRRLAPGEGVECPEGSPNSTVTFCNVAGADGGKRVQIFGNFAAADLGVCDPELNPYALLATTAVTYEEYEDQKIFRIPGRVSSAFRGVVHRGKLVCVGLSGQRYGVSTLTDVGPAYC